MVYLASLHVLSISGMRSPATQHITSEIPASSSAFRTSGFGCLPTNCFPLSRPST